MQVLHPVILYQTPAILHCEIKHSAQDRRWKPLVEDAVVIKIVWTSFRRVAAARGLYDAARTAGDPLSHPAIMAMSARELADLPLPRHTIRR
jgi:hypothetical protein